VFASKTQVLSRVVVGDKEILRSPTPREVLENSEKLLDAGVGYRAKTITTESLTIYGGDGVYKFCVL